MRFILLFALLLGPLVACSSEKSPEKQFCDDLDDVQSSLKQTLDAATRLNLSDTRSGLDKVKNDLDDLKKSAKEIDPDAADELSQAFDGLRAAVQALGQGGGGNLVSNARQVQTAATDFATTLRSLKSEYNCK